MESELKKAVDLYEKDQLNSAKEIAFADGHLDKFEEHVVRKIADLIHISHNDFIQSKLKNKN